MATFGNECVEDLVTCPYDPVHKLRKCRLQAHLTKCKKRVPEERKVCPFNAQHCVPVPEYQHHLVTCPNRDVMDRKITKCRDEGKMELPQSPDVVLFDENWENEICKYPAPGYDPKNAQKKLIFKDTSGMLPSEKKKFYKSLHSQNEEEEVLSEPEEERVVDVARTLKGLRQPKDMPEVMKFGSSKVQCSSLGLGRGVPPCSRRIAANFFGASKTQDHGEESESLSRGIGRGFTV